MNYESISVNTSHDGQVVNVDLGPPPGNIVTAQVMTEISAMLDEVASQSHVKLIVLSGQGRHFSYGASVEEHQRDLIREVLPRFHGLVEKMLECDVPMLAKVSGLCLGGGFELALACSFIYCDETAQFGVPEITLGVFPPPAAMLLPLKVGDAEAARLVLTGDKVSANEMHRLGAVSHVSRAVALEDDINAFITHHIIPRSAAALRAACKVTRMPGLEYFRGHVADVERLYLEELMATHDANEGIAAFLEKRDPVWKDE